MIIQLPPRERRWRRQPKDMRAAHAMAVSNDVPGSGVDWSTGVNVWLMPLKG
jgi:hypothetical protein